MLALVVALGRLHDILCLPVNHIISSDIMLQLHTLWILLLMGAIPARRNAALDIP